MTLCVLLSGAAWAQTVSIDGYVLKIDAKNQLSTILKIDGTGPDIRYGTADPVVSPNQKSVALIRERNGYLRDLATGKEIQFTSAGREGTKKLLPVTVFVVGFTPDSAHLYFNVARGKNDCPDCPNHNLTAQEADYGLFRYTISSGATEKVTAPGNIRLYAIDDQNKVFGTLVGDYGDQNGFFQLPDFKFTALPKECATSIDCTASLRGEQAECIRIVSARPQVLTCNAASAKIENLSPQGDCAAEFSHARISESGKHTAYLQTPSCKGDVQQLMVDKTKVFACAALSNFNWIGDGKLLVRCAREIDLLDLTGKKLGSIASDPVAPPQPD